MKYNGSLFGRRSKSGGTYLSLSEAFARHKIRSKPRGNENATTKQLVQQAKFSLAIKFVTPLSGLFNTGFKNYAFGKTGTNCAFSYLMANAIAGTYPDFIIDYPNMLMSRGSLPNVNLPVATPASSGDIVFTWIDNTGVARSKASDRAILVVYCPALQKALYTTGSAMRIMCTDSLNAIIFAGHQVETYIGFISEDGKEVASSVYTGKHTILS